MKANWRRAAGRLAGSHARIGCGATAAANLAVIGAECGPGSVIGTAIGGNQKNKPRIKESSGPAL